MNFKSRLFIYLLLYSGLFHFEVLTAQITPNLFAGKPDKKVKEVVCYLQGKDSSTIESIIKFDKNGNITREAQPDFYVEINYKYDKTGKLIEKDALYGESFANGTTKFQYNDNKVVESTFAMGFYSQSQKTYNKKKNIQKLKIYYIAAGMGESKIETEDYKYNKKNVLVRKELNIIYFDIYKEIGTIDEIPADSLINEIKSATVLKNEKYFTIYNYDKNNKLIAESFHSAGDKEKLWETSYKYNSKGLLVNESKVCNKSPLNITNKCKEYQVNKEYDAKGTLLMVTNKEKNFEQKLEYKDGRLVNTIEKYDSGDAIHYTYKYNYYSD